MINCTAYRNQNYGFGFTACQAVLISQSNAFGNGTADYISTGVNAGLYLYNCSASGDVAFTSQRGLYFNGGATCFVFNSLLYASNSISSNHVVADISVDVPVGGTPAKYNQCICNNCVFGTIPFATFSGLETVFGSFVSSQRHNQIANSHQTWFGGGSCSIDTTIFHTASPSLRMTPWTGSVKLISSPASYGFSKKVDSGSVYTPSVYVRKSVVGDGTAFSGSQPRLIVRQNVSVGINADTVLNTCISANGTWENLTGSVGPVTDNGVLEFYVDVDGGTGWINCDDFSAIPSAISTTDGMKYYFNGLPYVDGDIIGNPSSVFWA